MAQGLTQRRKVLSPIRTLFLFFWVARCHADDWREGRASYYGNDGGATIHQGSCGFWSLDPNAGTGWDIVAPSDCNDDFDKSCGRCYEIKCRPAYLTDGYGQQLDRDSACYDQDKTVVVRVTDSCPCYYPANAYSNKRWCCGDSGTQHFDMSYYAFQKLADLRWGVMGIYYRVVDCPPGTPQTQQWQVDDRNRKGQPGTTYRRFR